MRPLTPSSSLETRQNSVKARREGLHVQEGGSKPDRQMHPVEMENKGVYHPQVRYVHEALYLYK